MAQTAVSQRAVLWSIMLGCVLLGSQRAHALFEEREIAAVSSVRGAELFMIDADNSIKHYMRGRAQGSFSGVEQLDGSGRDVAAITRGDGMFEVFVVGMGGDVWSNLQVGRARWRGFQLLGFHCKHIAAARSASGSSELFVIGKDDVVYRSVRQDDQGQWSAWRSLGASASQLAAAASGNGVRVFTVASDHAVWTTDSEQVAWTRLGGDMRDVSATRDSKGTLTFVAADAQGAVWQRRSVDAGLRFGMWERLPGSATRVSAIDSAPGAHSVFALGERVMELAPGAQVWRELEMRLPLEITFYGVATLVIPSAQVTQQRAVAIGVRFSRDHQRLRVTSFPAFTTASFDTPLGKSTTTVSLTSGGEGTFDPQTGRLQLQVTLHFDQSLDLPLLQEDADLNLTLTSDQAKPLSQGEMFAEVGVTAQSRFTAPGGFNPLAGKPCQISISGYFVAPATLLRAAPAL